MLAAVAARPVAAPARPAPMRKERSEHSAEAADAPTLAIRRLALRQFRNYAHLALALDRRPVVLTGPNGAGKTNLIEAVSLLAPGRGLRRARLDALARRSGTAPLPGWALSARLESRCGSFDLSTGQAAPGERRRIDLDGSALRTQNALAELVGVLWLTPAHDRLFQESPAARRRFLDRLVLALDPAHAARLSAYERVLRERSLLLRMGSADVGWVASLERRIAEFGIAIAAARLDLARSLDAQLATGEGSFPCPRLAAVGETGDWLTTMPAIDAEERLAAALAAARMSDATVGGAGHGPHRDDLEVTDAQTGAPARDCSTGRQKSLLLGLLLANARLRLDRTGELPLLLLDEVIAHLDARRRVELFEALVALGAQAWLTGTDAADFANLGGRAQHFHVQDGSIETK
jgi:DNA replication and repair protein RecF